MSIQGIDKTEWDRFHSAARKSGAAFTDKKIPKGKPIKAKGVPRQESKVKKIPQGLGMS